MPQRFTIEEHEKRMRELLNPKPQEMRQRPKALQALLEKAKRKPIEGEPIEGAGGRV